MVLDQRETVSDDAGKQKTHFVRNNFTLKFSDRIVRRPQPLPQPVSKCSTGA